ncbi:MAG: leucine-rich repeat domain-containing protein [Alphaproteobacteria bacterium]|nr:leucine-rich repeat domain-containing protein [Alphaproteobacteria bacterium]
MRNKIFILAFTITTASTFNLQAYEGTVTSTGQCGKNIGDCVYTIYSDRHVEITGTGAMKDFDTVSCSSCVQGRRVSGAPWSSATSINISGITSIGVHAFTGLSSIQSVTMSDSVKSMGAGVFRGASGLTSVTLSNQLTSIPSQAFLGTKSLQNLTIPSSVKSVDDAFGLSGVTNLVIPKGVTYVRELPAGTTFEEGSQLERLGYNALQYYTESTFDIPDTLQYIDTGGLGRNLTSIFLPENFIGFGYVGNTKVFGGMTKLEELYCPKNKEEMCRDNLQKSDLSSSLLKTYESKGGVYALTDSEGNTTYFDSYANLKGGTVCADTTLCQASFMAGDGTYCSTAQECAALIEADKNGDVLTSGGKRYASLEDLYAGNPMPSIEEIEQSDGSYKVYKDGVFIGYKNKRIYTVEEASKLSKPTGNTFRLRYK